MGHTRCRCGQEKADRWAPTARQGSTHSTAFGIGTPLSFLALFPLPDPREGCNAVDIVTARSLASVGLIGLAGLPVLMLASVMLEAPLAGPAVISLGYLAAAHALAKEQSRRAAAWVLIVCSGFVAWTLLSFVARDDAVSGAGFAAIILAPVFAAAPALVRHMASSRADAARLERRPDAASLTLNAPRQPVLTHGEEPTPLPVVDELRPTCELPGSSRPSCPAVGASLPVQPVQTAKADVQEAVGFALRHIGPKARTKGIKLVCSGDSTIAVACDRQVCRKILHALIGEVVKVSPLGASVHILARGVRGAVLLRVSSTGPVPVGAGSPADPLDVALVRSLVEAIGGTLVATQMPDGFCASLRLARADSLVRQGRESLSSGAA